MFGLRSRGFNVFPTEGIESVTVQPASKLTTLDRASIRKNRPAIYEYLLREKMYKQN